MKWVFLFFGRSILLASLVSCVGVRVERETFDEEGRRTGRVVAEGPTSPDGAVLILESARQLDRTKLDGEAEKRAADTATLSVQKGQPTKVSTRGGEVTSGYVYLSGAYGYGGSGYYGSPYDPHNPYGVYSPYMFESGVSSAMVAAEEAGWMMRGSGQFAPPVSSSSVGPGINEQVFDLQTKVSDLQTNVKELLKIHSPGN